MSMRLALLSLLVLLIAPRPGRACTRWWAAVGVTDTPLARALAQVHDGDLDARLKTGHAEKDAVLSGLQKDLARQRARKSELASGAKESAEGERARVDSEIARLERAVDATLGAPGAARQLNEAQLARARELLANMQVSFPEEKAPDSTPPLIDFKLPHGRATSLWNRFWRGNRSNARPYTEAARQKLIAAFRKGAVHPQVESYRRELVDIASALLEAQGAEQRVFWDEARQHWSIEIVPVKDGKAYLNRLAWSLKEKQGTRLVYSPDVLAPGYGALYESGRNELFLPHLAILEPRLAFAGLGHEVVHGAVAARRGTDRQSPFSGHFVVLDDNGVPYPEPALKDTPYEKDFFFDEVPAHRFSATATEALEGGTARRIRELGIPPEMAPALADLETNQRAQVQLELRSGHAMARRTGRIAADVLTALEGGGLKPEIVSREGRKYHRVSVTVDGKKIAFLLAARDGKSLNDEVKSLRDRAREEERGFVAEWKRLGFSGDP